MKGPCPPNLGSTITRRGATAVVSAAAAAMFAPPSLARSPEGSVPVHWERHASANQGGYTPEGLARFQKALLELPTTSAMIVSGARIAYSYGDIDQVSYLASARKSVMSMLYGKYIADGRLQLGDSIGALDLDEPGGLLAIEKTATIRDMLTSSSGVYYPAASVGSDPDAPERGSQRPGERFVYNNWDFNVLGAVLERATGRSVFDLFEQDLAKPLGFEDYDPRRQRMLRLKGAQSKYAAYHMFLSARDSARLGLVMLRRGRWRNRQVVPEAWVKESTALHVSASKVRGGSEVGYGYLWWLPATSRTGPAWVGSFLAAGNYGQFILGLPALDTVIVHRRAVTDEFAIARNLGDTTFAPPGVGLEAFLRLADMVVAAVAPRR